LGIVGNDFQTGFDLTDQTGFEASALLFAVCQVLTGFAGRLVSDV
jgi:hypothetical protein